MKVLLSAYACEPNKGSEPGVGWNWAKQIARFHNVWVLTRANNKETIEGYLKENPIPNLNFIYFDLPKWARFWKRGMRGYRFYYYLWQIFAYFPAKRYHKKLSFDLSHHITFSPCFYPSFLSLLPIPFIWGPVGGVEKYPINFLKSFPKWAVIKELLRKLYIYWAFIFDPFIKLTLRKANLILACDKDTIIFLRNKVNKPMYKFSQIGIEHNEIKALNKTDDLITFLTVGRLVPKKGAFILLKAFIKIAHKFQNTKFIIASDGPEKPRMIKFLNKLHIKNKIYFTGYVSNYNDLKLIYKSADIFLMGSLQDSGGLVILEAMSVGLPVICFDLGSPGKIVTDKCGFKIPARNEEQAIREFSNAMEELICNKSKREILSQGALEQVYKMYTWDKKGETVAKIYRNLFR